MTKQTRSILILFLSVLVFYFVVRKLFEIMELSIKDYPKFNWTGKYNKSAWIKYATPICKVVGEKWGIPWQAMVVQSGVETGWGSSKSVKNNSFFGIKNTDGKNGFSSGTKEFINGKWITINSSFEGWKTPFEGFEGYAKFIHDNDRYDTALKYPNDPYKYLTEVAKAGYATAPNYASTLHNLLNKNFA